MKGKKMSFIETLKENALHWALNYFVPRITAENTKEAVLNLLGRIVAWSAATSNTVDDFFVKRLYQEFDEHYEEWFDFIRELFGLTPVLNNNADGASHPQEFVFPSKNVLLESFTPLAVGSVIGDPDTPKLSEQNRRRAFLTGAATRLGIDFQKLLDLMIEWAPILIALLK
jgi:hypothetical protein